MMNKLILFHNYIEKNKIISKNLQNFSMLVNKYAMILILLKYPYKTCY